MLRLRVPTLFCALATGSLLIGGCGGNNGSSGNDPDGGPPDKPPASDVISGTVAGYSGSAVDSDVNDPHAPFADNNTTETAQPLGNPVTLGGYVNAPGAGPDGRSRDEGDVVDVYRITLAAGQLVLLSFDPDDPVGAEDARAALQVYLLDLDGNPVLDAEDYPVEGRYQAETVRYFFAETAGEYLLAVEAIKGASTYLLVIDDYHGDGLSKSPARYVRNQVVARFEPDTIAESSAKRGRHHRSLAYLAGAPSRELLLAYDDASPGRFLAEWGGSHLRAASPRSVHARQEVRGPLTPRTAAMLMEADPSVNVAGANFILRPTLVPNDTHYDVQWAFDNIHAEAAWDVTSGAGIVVAVIDTGVDVDHPDLAANLTPGYDFVRDADNAGDADGIDPDPQQSPDGSHGTHVSGTIAAVTNNDLGVAGLAWGSRVMPLRALGLEGGTEYDVGQALRYAAGLDNDSKSLPKTAARVVNMSLGGPENSRWFQRVVYDVVRTGTVVVAAAGNENTAAPSYPASYQHVISVASTTRSNRKSSFSNFGPTVDLAAPGSQIGSTWGSGEYNYSSGTSMASPHVAAWVALMLSANPDLNPIDIENIIANEDVFTDLGDAGRDDDFGHGLIDAKKAVDVAAAHEGGAPIVLPELSVTPDQPILGPRQSSASVAGTNIGDGTLTVATATSQAPWTRVEGLGVGDNSVAFEVAVDRTALTMPGIYQTRVVVEASSGTHVVPVFVVVRDDEMPSDLGAQYVSLVNDSGPVATVPVVNGAFEFVSVAAGDYEVHATSDLDNDGARCGRGESCGAYAGADAEATVSPATTGVKVITDWLFQ